MYFKNFPKIYYPFYNTDQKRKEKISVNITNRLKIVKYIKNNKTNFNLYTIKDGERPDTLAHKLYDRSDLHWIFFLCNDMFNPYESWPMINKDLISYIDEKYKGTSLFTPEIWKTSESSESTPEIPVYNYEILYVPIEKITQNNLDSFKNDVYLKESNLCNIKTDTKIKVVLDGVIYDTNIIKINSEFYEIVVETKSWNYLSESQNYLIYENEEYGVKYCVKVPITRIISKHKNSIKEFRVSGEYRDPGQTLQSGLIPEDDYFYPYYYFVHPLEFSEKVNYGNFMNYDSETFADSFAKENNDGEYLNPSYYITNEYYELSLNERKRRIFVPKPSLVEMVIRTFEEIFKDSVDTNR